MATRLTGTVVPLVATGVLLSANARRWVFDVRATEAWWSLSLLVLGPLCATFGAYVVVRRRTTGLDALARTAGWSWLDQYARLLLEVAALLAAGLFVVFLGSMLITLSGSSAGRPRPVVGLVVLAWCLAFVSLGIALAHRFPVMVAAPIAGVLSYAFLVLPLYVTGLHGADRITPFGATPSAFSGPAPLYSAVQAVAGLAAAVWLLPAPFRWPRVVSGTALAASLVAVATSGPAAARVDRDAVHVTCGRTARVELCLTPSRERDRARIATALDAAVSSLGPVYPATTTVVQTIALKHRTAPRPRGPLLSTADAGLPLENGETLLPSEQALLAQVIYRLAAPAAQRDWQRSAQGPPPADVLVAWAYSIHGLPVDGSACPFDCYRRPGVDEVGAPRVDAAVRWFSRLPPTERATWLRDHRSRILRGELLFSDFA